MTKIVINTDYGGYSVSEAACKFLNIEWDDYGYIFDDDRANEKLVKCVETLGEKANGYYAHLKVVEIPDDVEWVIEEYDGKEWVSEKHRTWG